MNYFEARNWAQDSYVDYVLPAWIEPFLSSTEMSVLDVGCGLGQFLSALKIRGCANVSGIDADASAVEHCLRSGLNVELTTIKNFLSRQQTRSFDLIFMSHVLEHLDKGEAVDTLKHLRSLLNPFGVLVLAVPNAQSNTGAYWAFEDFTHTTLYTSGSIFFVAKMAGFQGIQFIDRDAVAGLSPIKKLIRLTLLAIYRANYAFWNKATGSAFHASSPQINSYEIKVALRR